jgi:HlyD family secretion protein
VQGIGYVEPASEVRRLVFPAGGVIDRCAATVGRSFRKGDVLMTLRNQEQQAALTVAEEELRLALAERDKVFRGVNSYQIAAAECRLELLEEQARHRAREQERARLLARGQAVSGTDYDKARTDQAQTEAARRQAASELRHLEHFVTAEDRRLGQAKVDVAQARVELLRARLEDTLLRAPFEGTVLEVLKREGESAGFVEREPVALYADLSRLRVRAEIEERYVHAVRAGQKAVVRGRGLGGRAVPGTVVLTKPVMGKKTVFSRAATERKDLEVIQVLVDLDEPLAAPVGLQVDVQVAIGE